MLSLFLSKHMTWWYGFIFYIDSISHLTHLRFHLSSLSLSCSSSLNEVHYLNHIHKTAHDTHNALDHETIGVVLLHQKVFSLKEITVCCVKHTRERTDEKLSTTEYRMNGKENTAHLMSIHLIPHRFECIDWWDFNSIASHYYYYYCLTNNYCFMSTEQFKLLLPLSWVQSIMSVVFEYPYLLFIWCWIESEIESS